MKYLNAILFTVLLTGCGNPATLPVFSYPCNFRYAPAADQFTKDTAALNYKYFGRTECFATQQAEFDYLSYTPSTVGGWCQISKARGCDKVPSGDMATALALPTQDEQGAALYNIFINGFVSGTEWAPRGTSSGI